MDDQTWLRSSGHNAWQQHQHIQDCAKRITARLKTLRYSMKKWTKRPSDMDSMIEDLNAAIFLFYVTSTMPYVTSTMPVRCNGTKN